MSFLRLIAAVLVAGIAAAAAWWIADRPVPVTAEWSKPLSSMSFAPYRRGESPITGVYPTQAEVEEDMKILVGRTRGIRTYTVHEGLESMPALAEKYGLKLTLGCWLGRDLAKNENEITALIEQANAHPESVQRVMVGNEVLLRGDLTPEQLIGYIRRVKAAIRQPVSTADVVSFVLNHPEVGAELDYVTVHILPFWDDYPIGIDGIEQDTIQVIERIRKAFPGKPILIGETGWPSIGRDRGPAAVNVVNEADFVRRMANLAADHDFDYNIVEDFDVPWKSQLEGTVGGAWGVMESDRAGGKAIEKFPMTGPVTAVADWCVRAVAAIALATAATLLLARGLANFSSMLVFAFAAQILAWLLVTSGFHAYAVTFRPWQYYWLIVRIGLPALLFAGFVLQLRERVRIAWSDHLMDLAALYAVIWSLLLLVDGYYRDIPDLDFCLPVGGVLVMVAVKRSFAGVTSSRRLIGWALVGGALMSMASEAYALMTARDFIAIHPTFADQLPYLLKGLIWNREMDLWAAMQLVWALPFLLVRRPGKAQAA